MRDDLPINADFRTDTWKRIQALLRMRLEKARTENDARLDAEKTATLRGRIAELKELLALAEKQAPGEADHGNDAGAFGAFPRS